MGPKIKALDEEFKETLDKYSVDSKTSILEVVCDKSDDMNIRKY
jgi:hypothetical protein